MARPSPLVSWENPPLPVRLFILLGRVLWRDTKDLLSKLRRGSRPHWFIGGLFLAVYAGMSVQNHRVREQEAALLRKIEGGRVSTVTWWPELDTSAVRVITPRIAGLLEEMMRRSPTFRREMLEVASGGIPVVIGSYADLGLDEKASFSGEVVFVPSLSGLRVQGALLAVHMALFDTAYSWVDEKTIGIRPEIVRDGEIMATIAHEFAHLYDVLRSGGNWFSVCRDPHRWQEDRDACVIRRENLFRRELGLPEEYIYGMALPEKAAARYLRLREESSR